MLASRNSRRCRRRGVDIGSGLGGGRRDGVITGLVDERLTSRVRWRGAIITVARRVEVGGVIIGGRHE